MITSGGKKLVSTLLKKIMPISGFFLRIQKNFIMTSRLSSNNVNSFKNYSQASVIIAGVVLFSGTNFQLL
jgi:hypothetical protein